MKWDLDFINEHTTAHNKLTCKKRTVNENRQTGARGDKKT